MKKYVTINIDLQMDHQYKSMEGNRFININEVNLDIDITKSTKGLSSYLSTSFRSNPLGNRHKIVYSPDQITYEYFENKAYCL